MKKDVIIVGGGAAGFFAGIHIVERNPSLKVAILERGKEVLTKVKISGGGRCNVTHAEFDPFELSKHYPRGAKELRGPFHSFSPKGIIAFFQKRGIKLKTEADGRMFPVTNSSQTIIDCFVSETQRLGIDILKNHSVKIIKKSQDDWKLSTNQGIFEAEKLLIASGSNPKIWQNLKQLGHHIIPPVPSLFTFNIKDGRIEGLAGLSVLAAIEVVSGIKKKLKIEGPLLITHWGMSGPVVLKLSAWAARELHALEHQFQIQINWLPGETFDSVGSVLKKHKQIEAKKLVVNICPFDFPKRLWQRLVLVCGIQEEDRWAEITKKQLNELCNQLTQGVYQVKGKSTFKEEFVTAGGIDLKEVNFKTFESKLHKNLYFAGEVLNIDAITGGFNFQNAWTGAYMAANAIAATT
ncbi:NAD(P)/FAD-dependent oxidoreductase [Leptobacterium sp. I13]|uniref:NAD(P)/FAD-dependent oxidoreductase n=1 Tax=Leptobacterium meishanense TaxID=3128904 RepID=UPI0030ECC6E8